MKYNNPIDSILDDNCLDTIILEDNKGNKYEYEQEALIPLDNKLYAILVDKKAIELEDFENAGEVFLVDEKKQELRLVNNINIINEVFEIYDKLFEEKQDKED